MIRILPYTFFFSAVIGIPPFVCFIWYSILPYFTAFFKTENVNDTVFSSENSHFTFLPFIQYHEIGENSTKVLDFSMLLRLIAPRQKKKNCKYRLCFCKSVQAFHAKEVCPTFGDRPPSEAEISPSAFSLPSAMHILNCMLGCCEISNCVI